jgi:release factor family 3
MIGRVELIELIGSERVGPCVSIYLPTHRRFPEQQNNSVAYRNLLKQVDSAQRRPDLPPVPDDVRKRLSDLLNDDAFWAHPSEGLAVFAAPRFFRSFWLPRAVPERAVVAGRFFIKPLLRLAQAADRFQVLALNRERIRLFEGNRDALEEIDLAPGVPATIEEALGEQLTELQTQVHSYGSGPAGGAERSADGGPKSGGAFHGQRSKKDEFDIDIERFFRTVDRAVIEHHSRPSGLPLILAALPEYHATFHRLSHNRQLLDGGIEANPDALSVDELRERAWQSMEPVYLRRLQLMIDRYGAAHGAHRADDALPQVALAAVVGRVDVLLLERDREVQGSMDLATGVLQVADTVETAAPGDVLDDLAEAVLQNGGEVVIVPAERMPSTTGLAAIYRY